MSITKCNLNSNYSKLPNGLVLDKNISTQALKVILYLWSLPDGWIVNNTDVCKKLGLRDRVIYKYWRELISSGWITRYQAKTKGKFGNFEYHLNEFPVKDVIEITPENRHTENRHTETLHTVETVYGEMGVLTNTHSSNNTHSNNNTHIIKEKINKKENNVQEVIDYFNQTCKANIKGDKTTVNNITTILKEFSVDDIKLVIDHISNDDWYIERGMVLLPVICRSTKFATKLAIAKSHNNKPIINNKPINNVKSMAGANCNTAPVEDDFAVLRRQKELGILNVDLPKTMWQLLTPEQKQKYLDKGFKPNE